MPTLDGVRVKLDRAEHHLADLAGAVQRFLDEEPILLEVERTSTAIEMYCTEMRPVPSEFATIAADCVSNIRASLDYIVNELSVGSKNRRNWSFPICNASADWAGCRARNLAGLSEDVANVVKSFQPFRFPFPKPGEISPLIALDDLWNQDKHRQVPLAFGTIRHVTPESVTATGILSIQTFEFDLIYQKRMRVLVAKTDPDHPAPHLDATLPCAVAYGRMSPAGGMAVGQFLGTAIGAMRYDVLPRFEPFF